MGKGDKKSKHGKIILGSYGVRRPRRKLTSEVSTAETADLKPKKQTVKPKAKEVDQKPKVVESKAKTAEPKAEVAEQKTEEAAPKQKSVKKIKAEPESEEAGSEDAG